MGRRAALQWDTGDQGPPPWEKVDQQTGHRVIATRRKPPEGLRWLEIKPQGVAKFRYMIRCKHHDCPGPPNKGTLYLAVLLNGGIRHEVQEALGVFLEEAFKGTYEYTP